ncbi:MAG: acyl-ACP--UDP-N-acetylglucosamine O-acyltransferase [Deltaproteobacteria bacterium]|jgi:UDP-N-acetylglucosamine acyltransferase|nr:acyl-ACP--UDP-N-acetylglucosamine O-acyltransferase [Deltaproteobacteria bacterium]MBT6432410.1 acyl-ACP--UDP-N-acetylglucosamine O-acyltransferase [Deltaproteobacteria bacterium]MBT6489515.1 acyl-ACP--UDP-N-acetylglucosamine O-acyltransferase [Deltaproteobacteria bacterium]
MSIHPSAIVSEGAQIHPDADIGPLCVVGPHVSIGKGTQLISHVSIQGHTSMGDDNTVHPFAVLGGAPQDLKYEGEDSKLVIGDNNQIREGATLNLGTKAGNGETRVGDHCLMMAYSHVAHDCILGSRVILANSVGLAGHVELGDHVIVGGLAGIHQFCRVGRNSFVAAGAMVAQDVVPFAIVQGDRAQHVGINSVGLRRSGWKQPQIAAVRMAFKRIFHPENARLVALEQTESTLAQESSEVAEMCAFIRSATRGVCRARQALPNTEHYEA